MSRTYIADMRENTKVKDVFYVSEKSLGTDKNGKSYVSIKLMDKTGTVDGKIWDRADYFSTQFDKDDFVLVEAAVSVFQGNNQLKVLEIQRAKDDEVVMEDFVAESPKDIPAMWDEFLAIGSSLAEPYLQSLFNEIFHKDTETIGRFKQHPAAKSLHHAYKGGLLEHSLNMVRLADMFCGQYPTINRDILIFSAMVHDIGKVWEIDYKLVVNYSDEGKLIGHITLADEYLVLKSAAISGFPRELLTNLRHILLSHHGEYEFGSPKRPKTIEAMALHFLDNMDAKMNEFQTAIERDTQSGNWTPVMRSLDRPIYKATYKKTNENRVQSASQPSPAKKKAPSTKGEMKSDSEPASKNAQPFNGIRFVPEPTSQGTLL